MKISLFLLTLLCGLPNLFADEAPTDNAQLANEARKIIRQHCYRCHQGEGSEGGDADLLTAAGYLSSSEYEDGRKLVVPNKPGESLILQKIMQGDMPPEGDGTLTLPETMILWKWIAAGSPAFASAKPREFISLKTILTRIRDHLRDADRDDRPFLRYFTLHNVYNNPAILDDELRLYRAGLSKAINSLSWKSRIVVPEAIDPKTETLFVIDIRELDWDQEGQWYAIMQKYPYGLSYGNHPNEELEKLNDEITLDLTKCDLPIIRADWFISEATRPPLYYQLLDLPENAKQLEHRLGVNILNNFLNPKPEKVARAAFQKSGVSGQNRLLERHESKYGAYWKSYDFLLGSRRANLSRFPLGPLSLFEEASRIPAEEDFSGQAFVHDGGEIIFHLPNGLQAYMLVDGIDKRIDAGPVEVVSDVLKTSGTPLIVNGVSCMSCHKHGMIWFKDRLRNNSAVFGDAEKKVRDLFPEQKVMDRLVQSDQDRFMIALKKATGSFLQVGSDKQKPLEEFSEPVGEIARQHRLQFLDLKMIANELDFENPQDVLIKVGEKKLKHLGLEALLKGGVIPRHEWEAVNGVSLMQELARELRFTPVRFH